MIRRTTQVPESGGCLWRGGCWKSFLPWSAIRCRWAAGNGEGTLTCQGCDRGQQEAGQGHFAGRPPTSPRRHLLATATRFARDAESQGTPRLEVLRRMPLAGEDDAPRSPGSHQQPFKVTARILAPQSSQQSRLLPAFADSHRLSTTQTKQEPLST